MNVRRWMMGACGVLLLAAASADAAVAQEQEIRRGWLGFSYAATEEDGDVTVRIERVYPGSPAAAAGIRAGDEVVGWNGTAEVTRALESMRLAPGDTVRLRVRRGEQRDRNLTIVAGRRPPELAAAPPRPPTAFGIPESEWRELREQLRGEQERIVRIFGDSIRLRAIPPDRVGRIWGERLRLDSLAIHADSLHRGIQLLLRDSLGPQLRALDEQVRFLVPEGISRTMIALGSRGVAGAEFEEMNEGLADYFGTDDGVLVLRVSPGTPASRAGLEPGDVVLEANGRGVRSVGDLREAVLRAQGAPNREVRLDVLRRGEPREIDLRWE